MSNRPIGVFDSGIGGLSVLRELLRLMPDESYIYLGDSARVPYGNKSVETVRLFASQCTQFLLSQDVKLVVVACNTVSAVALDAVQQAISIPVIEMIEPAAAAAVERTVTGNIGVIGTRATVGSRAYNVAIHRLQNEREINVYSLACPLFVPLVEEGWLDHPATRAIAQEYLNELFRPCAAATGDDAETRIDTLVLGCTHYPLLKPLLRSLLPNVHLIDCGTYAAQVAYAALQQEETLAFSGEKSTLQPKVRFCLTDILPNFAPIAERFLNFSVDDVERVVIDHPLLAPERKVRLER
jgi:glutamate racemase